jgi:hypothetical protein
MCSKCTLCVSLPNADIVIPMIIRKDPTVTARHACHRQADVTRPWERKLEKEGFTVSPTNGPQCPCFARSGSSKLGDWTSASRWKSKSVRVVSLARLAHRRHCDKDHHQNVVSLNMTVAAASEVKECFLNFGGVGGSQAAVWRLLAVAKRIDEPVSAVATLEDTEATGASGRPRIMTWRSGSSQPSPFLMLLTDLQKKIVIDWRGGS